MERIELQKILGETLKAKLEELKIPWDSDHARRFVRCCLRMAARVCLDHKMPPQVFLQLAMSCLIDEQKGEPAVVPSPEPQQQLN